MSLSYFPNLPWVYLIFGEKLLILVYIFMPSLFYELADSFCKKIVFTYIYFFIQVVDLIDKMLQLDPSDRISVEDALAHPCMATFHDSDDEPEGSHFDEEYESEDYSIDEWKSI